MKKDHLYDHHNYLVDNYEDCIIINNYLLLYLLGKGSPFDSSSDVVFSGDEVYTSSFLLSIAAIRISVGENIM